jgi:hypothetical protein
VSETHPETRNSVYKYKGGINMDAKSLVLMSKENGILTNELGSYEIETGLEFVQSAYVENYIVNLFISTDKDVEDEEFDEIYDNYSMDYLEQKGYEIEELEDVYNPTWCVKFKYDDDYDVVDEKLNEVLQYHEGEMKRIWEMIKK